MFSVSFIANFRNLSLEATIDTVSRVTKETGDIHHFLKSVQHYLLKRLLENYL